MCYGSFGNSSQSYTASSTSSSSTGTIVEISDKVSKDPFVEELKKVKNKENNTYMLAIHDGNSDPYPTPAKGSIKILIFDSFDACNVTGQIFKKNNFKNCPDIRKYFYHNKQFFEMLEVKQ